MPRLCSSSLPASSIVLPVKGGFIEEVGLHLAPAEGAVVQAPLSMLRSGERLRSVDTLPVSLMSQIDVTNTYKHAQSLPSGCKPTAQREARTATTML